MCFLNVSCPVGNQWSQHPCNCCRGDPGTRTDLYEIEQQVGFALSTAHRSNSCFAWCRSVAQWLDTPDSQFALQSIRPDFLTLRVCLAKSVYTRWLLISPLLLSDNQSWTDIMGYSTPIGAVGWEPHSASTPQYWILICRVWFTLTTFRLLAKLHFRHANMMIATQTPPL